MKVTRSWRVSLVIAGLLLAPASCSDDSQHVTGPVLEAITVTGPAVVGAGDIARCDAQNDEATAALLDTISGTVITLGDNVLGSSSTAPDFNNCYGPSWGRHKSRTRPSVGSYEYFASGAATYWQYFGAAAGDSGKGYYSYDVGTWHVVVLNSSINMAAGSPQEQWLQSDLTAHPTQCTLAYWHLPRFSSVPNSGGVQVLSSVKPLWDDLYAAGVEVVLNAHYQVYERFAPQNPDGGADPSLGIREFIVGTGGIATNAFNAVPLANSEVRNSGAYGVLKLTLGDGAYAWQFIAAPGKTFTDQGQANCHTTAPSGNAASVTVYPSSATIDVGATVQLTDTARDASGQPVNHVTTWSSNNTAVARVGANGLVTGWAAGAATISATVDGQSGTASITVNATTNQILVGAGDIATCAALYDEATADLLDQIPGTVFTAGDNAYDSGTPDQFTNCYGPSWGRHKARTRPAVGNHEYSTPNAAGYFGYFGAAAGDSSKGYYSYDLGAWHVVVLNNYKPMAAGTAQESWLRADLAASTKQCTIAVWHEPLFTSGVSHAGAGNTQPLWQALYAAGGEIVIVGHDHDYERFAPMTATGATDATYGVREFVAGTGGAGLGEFTNSAPNSEVRNNSTHGVLKLTLKDGGYDWEFIPEAGGTFTDSGSGNCHGAPGSSNQLPTASYTSSCTGLSCAFTDHSSDPDGSLVNWSWAFGDGTTATVQNPTHNFTAAGTYTVRLTVTDDKGGTGITSRSVTVGTTGNQPPTAAYTSNCVNLACTFTDQSSDTDGTVTAWSWKFGDGATATTRNPSHTYAAGGTYSVTLTATDDKGATGAITKSVTVAAANQSPTAAFTSSCSGLGCSFTDQSSDPDGTVASWSWTFGDGATSTSRSPSHTYSTGGTYSVKLTVTDNDGATGTVTHSVTVSAPNQAPTAAFTSSCSGLGCSFTDQSSDPDGTVASWSWTFGDGATSTARNPSHTYSAGGTYSVKLTVTDNDGATGTVTNSVTVVAANQSPSAAFTSSCSGLGCSFTDQSTDADGTVASWGWNFGDGATSSTRSPSHTYSAGGTYSVMLTVTDNDGATGTVTHSVTVTTPNQSPTAGFTSSCSGLGCSFTDQSSDPDGSIASRSWDFGDGGTSTSQNPSHTYAGGGTYSVRLTVTDHSGATGTVTHSVTVSAPNQAPSAAFSSSCSGLGCAFTDQSTDPDGTVSSWSWTFGDGATSTTRSPSHTYAAGGTYSVKLTVTDNDGATGTITHSVTVSAPNQSPTAAFTSSCSGLGCSFTDQSSDPDGSVSGWSWDFGDGATASTQSPSHTYSSGGTYSVRLTATDNDGASSTVTHSVTVTAPNRAPTVNAGGDVTMAPGLFTLVASFTDPDNDGPWSYTIDWGDLLSSSGSTSATGSITATHPYAVPGTYTVRVTVTDSHGASGSDTMTLTIKIL